MADDSDDDFVSYGTALEPIENDEVRRKPVLLEDQVVTDKQGRRRFHGAFTGGFSAGYFNSVGTKEGWTPSTFVSSRGPKTGGQSRQRAEDFMDEEDLGDFGIAPRKIVTTENFAGEGHPLKRPAARPGPSVIPGDHPLQDLIVMNNESIGARLLRKMGWRQGQGVGTKVRRRKKSAPSGLDAKASVTEDNDEDEDDDFLKDFLFAPADVEEIALSPKDNHHGLGYRGLDPAKAGMGGHVSLFQEQPVYSRSGRRGIAGQAFGVGAFETADDNIYGVDSMANYDRVLGGEEPGDSNYGWTAPEGRSKAGTGVLEKFQVSSQARPPNKMFPPPVLPKDFRPFHTTDKSLKASRPPQAAKEFQSSRFTLSAPQRAAMLGEEQLPGPSTVFDFLSAEDRKKLQSSSLPSQSSAPSHSRGPQVQEPAPSRFDHAPSSTPAAPTASDPRRLQALGGGFQPFASDAAKQQRYEEYLARKRIGKDQDVAPPSSNLTEWERQHEAEEFARASTLYQPLSGLMATRFVTAKQKDDEETVDVPAEEGGDKSEQAKAADLKMFGKLTRDTLEWHPDSLLCKRFNLPNPYPGSSVVGLPTVKKDKFSVFNFLSIAPAPDAATAPPSSEPVGSQQSKEKASRWDKRSTLLANVGVSGEKEDGVSSGQTQVEPQLADDAETESRPPMDLFKAIFADSSSSSSSEKEEEGAEEEKVGGGKESRNRDEPNYKDDGQKRSSRPSGMVSAEGPHPHGIPTASNGLDSSQTAARKQSRVPTPPMNSESESEEMYGPRLPPASSSASSQSVGDKGQGSGALPRDTSAHRRSKSHRKEKRRKKDEGRSSSRHKPSKEKKKSKKKKKTKKKETKVRHKGHHHRSSTRSGQQGQRRGRVLDAGYDASESSNSSSSSEDSN